MQAAHQRDLRPKPLSIRRGQVWTSVVRMARDARAEQYRATILAPLEARRRENLAVLADPDESPMARHIAQGNLAHINGEIARRVPDAPAAAARFEAPLVRDKRTAKPNKYASAPAGTRASHKRTCPMDRREDNCWLLARTAKIAARETVQSLRRAGFSASEIRVMVWEPLRIRREVAQFGKSITVTA